MKNVSAAIMSAPPRYTMNESVEIKVKASYPGMIIGISGLAEPICTVSTGEEDVLVVPLVLEKDTSFDVVLLPPKEGTAEIVGSFKVGQWKDVPTSVLNASLVVKPAELHRDCDEILQLCCLADFGDSQQADVTKAASWTVVNGEVTEYGLFKRKIDTEPAEVKAKITVNDQEVVSPAIPIAARLKTTGVIYGWVKNALTMSGLANAKLDTYLSEAPFAGSSYTNSYGNYTITRDAGSWKVTAMYNGFVPYIPDSGSTVTVVGNQSTELNITLQKNDSAPSVFFVQPSQNATVTSEFINIQVYVYHSSGIAESKFWHNDHVEQEGFVTGTGGYVTLSQCQLKLGQNFLNLYAKNSSGSKKATNTIIITRQ